MTAPAPDDQRLADELLELARQVDAQRAALPHEWPGMTALHASVHNRLVAAALELRRAAGELRAKD